MSGKRKRGAHHPLAREQEHGKKEQLKRKPNNDEKQRKHGERHNKEKKPTEQDQK